MVRVTLLCVGRLSEPWLRAGFDEYAKRLSAFWRLDTVEIAPVLLNERSDGEALIARALGKEGQKILAAVPRGSLLTALCVEGKELSSPQLSEWLQKQQNSGRGEFAFAVGSSHGLSQEVIRRADLCLSMGPMTFTHQMARVMLLEQLYRAQQIAAGTRYHK